MNHMDKEAVLSQVRELIQPLLASRRTELVELTCRPEGSRVVLRCLVDTARGITVDELSRLNQAIGALLDEHDLIPDRYLLEVSSPGLDRPLKTQIDFERTIGRRIRVMMTVPVDSQWEMTGELLGAGEEMITLKLDNGDKLQILLSQISRAVQEIKL
ncbi:MAG: ribosome maturation factor RimP [Candidatus Omnitrophica bacterium]|nr:ribosome maturation factor RimP [Candidatus Omnitrophota bacterium]